MMSLRFSLLVPAVMALAACGTLVDTPNQKIQVLTPGATGARCHLKNYVADYVVNPPQMIVIRRAQETLTVTCDAPGNRTKTVVVRSRMNGDSMGNALNAGVGFMYDQISGGLYQYPDVIEVDFTGTRAGAQALPAYHAPDTVSPFDFTPETVDQGDLPDAPRRDVPAPHKPKPQKKEGEKSGAGGTDVTTPATTSAPAAADHQAEGKDKKPAEAPAPMPAASKPAEKEKAVPMATPPSSGSQV